MFGSRDLEKMDQQYFCLVYHESHGIQIRLALLGSAPYCTEQYQKVREIRALREVLPKESVCVFVGTALPRTSRITEIHLGVRCQGEGFVVREFHAAIPGQ